MGKRRITVAMFTMLACAQAAWAGGVVGTGTPDTCTDAALDMALTGGGWVTFNCGGAVTIDVSTGTGAKRIAVATVVDGAGVITLSGGRRASVFSINSGAALTLKNLTIVNGYASGAGGAIDNAGTLTIRNVTFSSNAAGGYGEGGYGGAIHNAGTLTISESNFSSNMAGGTGGAIDNRGALIIANSTFRGNQSLDFAGAIGNEGTLTVTTSTFTENTAIVVGGAISDAVGTTSIIANSTFNDNFVTELGGAIFVDERGLVTITNSTFTGNEPAGIVSFAMGIFVNTIVNDNCSGTIIDGIIDGGHNIESGATCGFSAANASLSGTNAKLDPAGLANNGGPTQTIALLPGSPAINAGDEMVCAAAPVGGLDQRGYARPGTGHTNCSIGAYEDNSSGPTAVACVGDCDGNTDVTVAEIITLVNIDLGLAEPAACPDSIPSGRDVDITLIVQAVGYALTQCPSP